MCVNNIANENLPRSIFLHLRKLNLLQQNERFT